MWDNHLQVIKIEHFQRQSIHFTGATIKLQPSAAGILKAFPGPSVVLTVTLVGRRPRPPTPRAGWRGSHALSHRQPTICEGATHHTEESAQPLAQTLSLSSPSPSPSTSSSSSPSTLTAVITGSWALPNHQSQQLSDRCHRRSSSSRARASAGLADYHHH